MSGELIEGNKAEYGGGIAVKSDGDISFDGDIQGNTATQLGGAIYLEGGLSDSNPVSFSASNYHIVNNIAVERQRHLHCRFGCTDPGELCLFGRRVQHHFLQPEPRRQWRFGGRLHDQEK